MVLVLQLSASNGPSVVLRNVGLRAEGRYKCEVLSDAPSFLTHDKSSYLSVVGGSCMRYVIAILGTFILLLYI